MPQESYLHERHLAELQMLSAEVADALQSEEILFFGVLVSYLLLTYALAAMVSRIQLIIFNGVYILFSLGLIYHMHANWARLHIYWEEVGQQTGVTIAAPEYIGTLLLYFGMLVGSLYFMWTMRTLKDEEPTPIEE